MNRYWQRVLLTSVLVLIVGAPALLAQKYELNAYGGSNWAGRTYVGQLKTQAIWGGRAGIFLEPSFELEGNLGFMNQFEVKGIDPKSRGFLWELAADYNFSAQDWPVVRKFTPFVLFGAGGITTELRDAEVFSFTSTGVPIGAAGPRTITMRDGDTFFTISYGGGFKSVRLAGPLGLRFDVRGRTLPNYYHSTPTWLEASAGVNFMWGEP